MSRRHAGPDRVWMRARDDGESRGPGPDGPQPAELYKVETGLLPDPDPHHDAYRPAVVIQVLADVRQVRVCTRTTQEKDGSGVHHPADPSLDLNADGWFRSRWYQGVELSNFVYPLVLLTGTVEPELFEAIVAEVSR